ncbi:hypothetical protein BC941DRAFT_362362 [Chlamydoabsidia padenii]|nr:hypothetical protein BC941DRAFT_362362 [Chlamydoabsidia padenii]
MPLFEKLRKRELAGIDFTNQLFSDELVLGTFTYLSAQDLIECGKVNHAWSRLARDAGLWRPLYEEKFNKPLCTFKAKWDPVAEYQLSFSNWKDQYRIHQNWLTGQQRQMITFMKLKETTEQATNGNQGYRLTIGNSMGGFDVWTITTMANKGGNDTTRLVETLKTNHYQTEQQKGGTAVVALDVYYPMLIMCTANMKLQAFDISYSTPRKVFLLESPIPWAPVILNLARHRSSSTTATTQWRAILCYGMMVMGDQSSIGTQEIIFNANGMVSSRHSSILDPRSTLLTTATSSEPHTVPSLTSIVYSEPFLMTAHTSNTIKEYRLVSTPDQFTIEFVRTYYGHTCQVSSLALDSHQGRLISGSRAGLKIWDLLGLDQYKIRAKDYVVTLKPGEDSAMDIPQDDIVWIQMDDFKIVALLRNGNTNQAWFKIWSFDP